MKSVEFNTLLGKTIIKIVVSNDQITFIDSMGNGYEMYHEQDCCESVTIDDIVGDFDDLLNTPILLAEETTNSDDNSGYESATWTFYKLATIKGYVDIRWFGNSNGYYSESVNLYLNDKTYKTELREYKIDLLNN